MRRSWPGRWRRGSCGFQGLREFFVQPAEAAVAHDEHVIAGARDVAYRAHDAGDVFGAPVLARAECKALHRRPTTLREHGVDVVVVLRRDEEAIAGHGAYEVMKLTLDGGEVGKDVGVVEYEIVQHGGARAVMNEFRALVEERGVVFVGLHHEKGHVAEARRETEIVRHAADQKAGPQAGVFQYPREHAAGGGLAVRARDREYPAVF